MEIVTDVEIIEKYRVTKNFIDKHSRKMGAFSRNPRKFILSRVEAYISDLATQNAAKVSPEIAKLHRKAKVNELFEQSVNTVRMRNLKGRAS